MEAAKEDNATEAKHPIPIDFYCPISEGILTAPVVAADGFTYNRNSIERWFSRGHRVSPITLIALSNLQLLPNVALGTIVEDYCKQHDITRVSENVLLSNTIQRCQLLNDQLVNSGRCFTPYRVMELENIQAYQQLRVRVSDLEKSVQMRDSEIQRLVAEASTREKQIADDKERMVFSLQNIKEEFAKKEMTIANSSSSIDLMKKQHADEIDKRNEIIKILQQKLYLIPPLAENMLNEIRKLCTATGLNTSSALPPGSPGSPGCGRFAPPNTLGITAPSGMPNIPSKSGSPPPFTNPGITRRWSCSPVPAGRLKGSAGETTPAIPATYAGQAAAYSWGRNDRGQLGHGDAKQRSVPFWLKHLNKTVISIACGGDHTLAIDANKKVYSWGYNASGQLGLGHGENRSVPCLIEDLKDTEIVGIACGFDYSMALSAKGHIYTWGGNEYGKLGHGDCVCRREPKRVMGLHAVVSSISCGHDHAVALADKSLFAWGGNNNGQLGNGSLRSNETPVRVPMNEQVLLAQCGAFHTVAATSNNMLLSWGANNRYQLGHGDNTMRKSPTVVQGLLNKGPFKQIGCGYGHTLVLLANFTVFAWGSNSKGQLGEDFGDQAKYPVKVTTFKSRIIAISCGHEYSVAITDSARLLSWGCNRCGQLGHDPGEDCTIPMPAEIMAPVGLISCGYEHLMCLFYGDSE